MEKLSDVVIVSAFGRGHGLAHELRARKWDVTLVDLTSSLMTPNQTNDADWEGPFGLFESSGVSSFALSSWMDEANAVSVEQGLVIWTREGILEMNGPMSQSLFKFRKIPQIVQDYLHLAGGLVSRAQGTPEGIAREQSRMREKLTALEFSENWLGQFAHSFGSVQHLEFGNILHSKAPVAPLTARFHIRRPNKKSLEASFVTLEGMDVQVIRDAKLTHLRSNGKQVLDLDEARMGALKSKAFVWLLDEDESRLCCGDLYSEMVEKSKPMTLSHAWVRAGVKLANNRVVQAFPEYFVLVPDPYLPWEGENCVIVRKGLGGSNAASQNFLEWDLWMKIPIAFRQDLAYREARFKNVITQMREWFPESVPTFSSKKSAVESVAESAVGPTVGPAVGLAESSAEKITEKITEKFTAMDAVHGLALAPENDISIEHSNEEQKPRFAVYLEKPVNPVAIYRNLFIQEQRSSGRLDFAAHLERQEQMIDSIEKVKREFEVRAEKEARRLEKQRLRSQRSNNSNDEAKP